MRRPLDLRAVRGYRAAGPRARDGARRQQDGLRGAVPLLDGLQLHVGLLRPPEEGVPPLRPEPLHRAQRLRAQAGRRLPGEPVRVR